MPVLRLAQCIAFCLFLSMPVLAAEPTDVKGGSGTRLSILMITADDMNFDSLGCFGNKLKGVSPNLDKLAEQGVRFEQAYVTIAICQPCRASIMTARYPHTGGALGFDKINKGVPTLPETLKASGYYNACIGKAVHTIPSRHKTAFDETYDMADLGNGRSPKRYSEATADAIAKAKTLGKPFFLNVNLHDPHRPFANAPQENRKKRPKRWHEVPLVKNPYKPSEVTVPGFLPDIPEVRKEMAEYYTSVRRCDQIIGEVLKVLDQSGRAGDTIVLFLSDHGIAVPFAKTNCYMHSNRTPLLVRWPGVAKPGTVVKERMVSSIDLAPTLLDILGLDNLKGADGKSFRGLMDPKASPDTAGRQHVFVHLNYPHSRKPFPMRGLIRKDFGYVWNGWADGKTTFRNESMSGRTFKAMAEAGKNNPKIAARVKHYLYRCPEELYLYSTDPDALHNQVDKKLVRAKRNWASNALLQHMKETNDPKLGAYIGYLRALKPENRRGLDLFEKSSQPPG